MYSIEMRENSQLVSFFRVLVLTVYIEISSGEGMNGFHTGSIFCCAHGRNVQIENIHIYVYVTVCVCIYNCVPQFQ